MSRPMKHSGVDWLGDIPADWDIVKLKYLFSIVGGNGFPDILQGNATGDYPFCKVSDINGETDYVDTASNWVTQSVVDSNRFNVIPTGSILMAKIGAALAKNHRKINTVPCCIDNNTQALVPRRDDDMRYLFHLSKCIDMSWFDNNSTVPSINNPKLLSFFVPVPPLDEQQRIANFLDDECRRIDSVIDKTRASIDEYKKLKQALITRAVTKGIRPNRPTKTSGVDWLGDIPTDWNVVKLKYVSRFMQTKYSAEDGDLNYICLENVVGWTGAFIKTDSNYALDQLLICEAGDILFGKLRPYLAKVYLNTIKQCCSAEFAVIRMNDPLCKPFFWYQLISHGFIFTVDSSTYGTKMPRANATFIKNMCVVVPPLAEQQEIAAYLDEKTAAIDLLIAKKIQLAAELEQLKKSLIFEYVTGKKELQS